MIRHTALRRFAALLLVVCALVPPRAVEAGVPAQQDLTLLCILVEKRVVPVWPLGPNNGFGRLELSVWACHYRQFGEPVSSVWIYVSSEVVRRVF